MMDGFYYTRRTLCARTAVHDALYQFLPDDLPLTRRHADRVFLLLLAKSEFAPRWLYWAVVRLLGGIGRRVARLKRKTRGTRQRVAELCPYAGRKMTTASGKAE